MKKKILKSKMSLYEDNNKKLTEVVILRLKK